jgi:hypothetical protein
MKKLNSLKIGSFVRVRAQVSNERTKRINAVTDAFTDLEEDLLPKLYALLDANQKRVIQSTAKDFGDALMKVYNEVVNAHALPNFRARQFDLFK